MQNLIIQGSPPLEALEAAWLTIYSEFSEIVRDQNTDLAFLNIKQATVKRYRIAYLSVLLSAYKFSPTEDFEQILRSEGFKVNQDKETTFKLALGKIKRMQDDANLKDKQSVTTAKTDFDVLISDVERFQGYSFDQDKMTVRHFANIYKRYKDHNERENRKKGSDFR